MKEKKKSGRALRKCGDLVVQNEEMKPEEVTTEDYCMLAIHGKL